MQFRKLSLCILAATSLFAASKIFPYPYVQEDLPNGLRLITIPTDYPNIVSLYIVVGAGSRNEVEPGKSGRRSLSRNNNRTALPAVRRRNHRRSIQLSNCCKTAIKTTM